MENDKHPSASSSFLCSPIPRDPSQVFYVEDSSRSVLRQEVIPKPLIIYRTTRIAPY